jgi:hypothetical protein
MRQVVAASSRLHRSGPKARCVRVGRSYPLSGGEADQLEEDSRKKVRANVPHTASDGNAGRVIRLSRLQASGYPLSPAGPCTLHVVP